MMREFRLVVQKTWEHIVGEGRRVAGRAHQWFNPVSVGTTMVLFAAAYLLLSVLALADREGHRTLASLSGLITFLRRVGGLVWKAPDLVTTPQVPQILALVLCLMALFSLLYLRRYRPKAWSHDVALAVLVPLLVLSALLIHSGDLWRGGITGLLAGICLIACGPGTAGGEPSGLLVLVPVALGLLLRFYALAEVPNGYAEHSVVHHVDFSIRYLESFAASLEAGQFQPFLQTASNALLREHSGTFSLIGAIGFWLFGVSLTVTRLVSAVLGTLTVYVAYRLGKALDGGRLGLVFAFIVAAAPWLVTMSRFGTQEHVLSPLHLLLSILFLVLAVNGGRVTNILLAAIFIAGSWYVYASNLVVPLIAGLFLLARAAFEPRIALRNWRKVLLGLGCFALLSVAPVREYFSEGLLQPNTRTGYQGTGAIFSDIPKRRALVKLEAGQIFRHADDPWFSIPGPGVGLLQSALMIPGLVITAASLPQRRHRDLALLVLIGIPLSALPAILAPDASFRRLMPFATLVALMTSFVLVRSDELARAAGVPSRVLTVIAWTGAFAMVAAGTFGYFDRVHVEEEVRNAPFRALGEMVSASLGKQPLIVVVPRQNNVRDTHRYIELMAYDMLGQAERQGITQESFYDVVTCEANLDSGSPQPADGPPPILILHNAVPALDPNCGPTFVAKLKKYYPLSTVLIAEPPALPADLAPAPP